MNIRWVVLLALCLFINEQAMAAPGGAAPRKPKVGENEAARRHYKEGLRHRDAAWVYEEKMAGTKEEDRASYARFIQITYKRALDAFEKAVEVDPKFHQAFSSLGYVLRKTGDLDGAMKAYGQALKLNPSYSEAIEYRAEAYLIQGRVEEMKKAYGVLAALNRPHAARLLTFVNQWADGETDMDLAKSVRAWAAEKKEELGEVKMFVEKW